MTTNPLNLTNQRPDFSIARLGEAQIKSPLKLSTVTGDYIGDFTGDDERIVFNPNLKYVRNLCQKQEEPPSMEVAGPRDRLYFKPGEPRAAIVTCGGLSPGINDVIRALVLELWHHYQIRDIVGIKFGYRGLAPENFHESIALNTEIVHNIHESGGSFLQSSRGPQSVKRMVDTLEDQNIQILFAIGGDGTQQGALEIAKEIERRGLKISVIGIPKTIDNDIPYTERTFGFETAFAIAKEVLVAGHTEARSAMNGIGLVKLMGRHSGYIAALAALATGEANFVLVPEVPFELHGPKGFLEALRQRLERRRHALVVLAEGAGQDLLAAEIKNRGKDPSGNIELGDIGLFLEQQITEYFKGLDLEFTLKYIDPSYFIRSAPASAMDAVFCQELAQSAVHAAMSGRTAMIVAYWNQHYVHVPMAMAISRRKQLNPDGPQWRSVLEATGQPAVMKN